MPQIFPPDDAIPSGNRVMGNVGAVDLEVAQDLHGLKCELWASTLPTADTAALALLAAVGGFFLLLGNVFTILVGLGLWGIAMVWAALRVARPRVRMKAGTHTLSVREQPVFRLGFPPVRARRLDLPFEGMRVAHDRGRLLVWTRDVHEPFVFPANRHSDVELEELVDKLKRLAAHRTQNPEQWYDAPPDELVYLARQGATLPKQTEDKP